MGECGRDATEAFEDVGHSDEARDMLKQYLVGSGPVVSNTHSINCCSTHVGLCGLRSADFARHLESDHFRESKADHANFNPQGTAPKTKKAAGVAATQSSTGSFNYLLPLAGIVAYVAYR